MAANGVCRPIVLSASDKVRFHALVDRRGPDDCWPWKAARFDEGYGQFHIRVNGKHVNRRAHRVAWFLVHGAIPKHQDVLHACDEPSCCNPRHMFLGTFRDNTADMVRKNRQAQGTRLPQAKLNPAIVRVIRLLRANERRPSLRALAKRFEVSVRAIQKVEDRVTWKSVAQARPLC